MMKEKLGWQSATGRKLAANVWKPENEIKAVVVLIHGFGEHCMRYSPYIQMFKDKGFAFISYDQIGHGASEGKRGAIVSYKLLLNDVQICLDKAKEYFPELPVFLYGHSMGGNIVFNYLIKEKPDVAASIITSPWFQLANVPGAIAQWMVSLLCNIIPNVTVSSGLEINYISTLAEEVEKYRNDKLNHGKISFRLFNEITKSGEYAINNPDKIEIPVLLLHGTDDNITSANASKEAAANNPERIEFIEFEGCYHELHNDKDRDKVVACVSDFINNKI